MTITELCQLPLKNIVDKDCKLFLWATIPLLQKAFTVIEAWGFTYRTIAFVWVKLNKNCNKLFFTHKDISFGIGHWTASNCELCLAGLMPSGRLNRQSRSISQVVLSPRREHSRKPDEVRDKIVELCGDIPRIELFARQRVKGWDVWGDEVESDVELGGDAGISASSDHPGQRRKDGDYVSDYRPAVFKRLGIRGAGRDKDATGGII